MIAKVCGLTARTDLAGLADLPVDWGGFIFVRSSPRYAGRVPLVLPGSIRAFGVFRDEPVHSILRTARAWSLGGVQLHGDEPAEDARALKGAGLVVVKAIGLSGDGGTGLTRASAYGSDDVDYLLFDTPGGGRGGRSTGGCSTPTAARCPSCSPAASVPTVVPASPTFAIRVG